MNGNTELEGRVEVFHNGQWGTVCDNHFNEAQAQVICKIMGYERRFDIVAHIFLFIIQVLIKDALLYRNLQ